MTIERQKILFIDHTAVMGGAELCLVDLATAYINRGKVLLFQDGNLKNHLQNLGVEVSIAKASKTMLDLRTSGGLNSLITIPELWNLAGQIAREARGYDLILANSQKAFVTAALATLRGSPPVLWYLHDILTAKHFSRVNRQVAVFLANRFAAKILVNSQATGKAFIAAGGKKPYDTIYNGFDARKFDAVTDEEIAKVRFELGIGNAPLVGLFSRLSYWKGQHVLLSAVKDLPEVHVILVGDALFGEEEYVGELKTLAAIPELKGRIHWLGFRNDVPALMKDCDIIAHTSTEPEPFGRVIVEGQLAQKPTIASAAGGALELIDDGVTGCLFPLEDAATLSKQIERLVSDRSLADKIAQQGYSNAKTNFALDTILKSFARSITTV
jgi:glycosyltransferase involved in cell wall biosynthesis